MFTMDIETCDKIAKELIAKGIKTYVVHSNFNDSDNKNTLSSFRLAKNGILISAKMLDEGADSDATVGINVSSSRTKLQSHRNSRISRNYPGEKPNIIHTLSLYT